MSRRKHILSFFIILSLLSSTVSPIFVKKAQADVLSGAVAAITSAGLLPHVPTGDTVGNIVMTTLRLAAKAVAQRMIEQMVSDTVRWINSGFNGGPGYVTNPAQYFSDIANGVAGNFIHDSRLGFLCAPLKSQVLASLQFTIDNTYAQPLPPYACTATGIWGNIQNFQDSFAGGWDSWFQITQNDSNNPYGASLEARASLSSAVESALGLAKGEYDINKGFLSFKDKDGNIKTPGTVIEAELNDHLGSGFGQLVNAKEFDDLIDAFMAQLLKKTVFTSTGGLFSDSAKSFAGTAGSSGQGSTFPMTCAPSAQSSTIGDKISWSVGSIPPAGVIEYTWQGDEVDPTQDKTGTVDVTYAQTGVKKMTLTASTSDLTFDTQTGEESMANHKTYGPISCTGSVLVSQYRPLSVSCSAQSTRANLNEPVHWVANISGGSGKFDEIQWDGSQQVVPKTNGLGNRMYPRNIPDYNFQAWFQGYSTSQLDGAIKPQPSTVPTPEATVGASYQDLIKDDQGIFHSTLKRIYIGDSKPLGDMSASITVVDHDPSVAVVTEQCTNTVHITDN